MNEDAVREILKVATRLDLYKGMRYRKGLIKSHDIKKHGNEIEGNFLVGSENYDGVDYNVKVVASDAKIKSIYCTCPKYEGSGSCKHIVSCIYNYADELLVEIHDGLQEGENLLEKLKSYNKYRMTKKEIIKVEPYLSIDDTYYNMDVSLSVKIGIDKMYELLNKFSPFKRAFDNGENYKFGTNFTMDLSCQTFDKKSLQLFGMLDNILYNTYVYSNHVILSDEMTESIIDTYKDNININGVKSKVIKGLPMEITLEKDDKNYILSVADKNIDMNPIGCSGNYIYSDNKIYELNLIEGFLLNHFIKNKFNNLKFPLESFDELQRNLLSNIKENLKLGKGVENMVITSKPDVSLYFDINENSIECNFKLKYGDIELDYFDDNRDILRDGDCEYEVVKDILEANFTENQNKFILDDIDLMCEFMETGLDKLALKYQVFTSENYKKTSIIKNNSVLSTFHLGENSILEYEFDLGAISNSEIDSVMESLKQNKKYYRLKSGDILSLEDDSLNQLSKLSEDLELTGKDLLEGSGTIPKYRALYLDSIKDKKYNIIKTDSLFQKFISQFKKFHDATVSFSKDEEETLRDYQKDGVKWLYTIYKCGFGGILADEMGLGKSIQTIIFIRKLLEEDPNSKFLIVCPTALVYNWGNEFKKFAPEINVKLFSGLKDLRRSELEKYEGSVFVTSYGLLREDLDIYKNLNFKTFIIDEAQNIKNPTTGITSAVKSITAEVKLALTGTPVENSVVELWSIFDFIMPGFLSSLVKFQKKYKIKEFDKETNQLLKNLKVQVKPFILRRKKSDVVKDLPEKIENNIFIDLTEEQKKVYAAEVKYANEEMSKMVGNGGFNKNKMMILSLLTKLRQICIDPKIILEDYKGGSAKIENLITIIKEVVNNNHKILLFTSFKTALNIVKEDLDIEGITSYTIAGDVSSKKRQELVDAFNKDTTSVFLIMLKSGGTGLNLTSADVVIHLDLWWNPQAENQATDRTHRIGQTKVVEVIKLICKGTIEEKILELQKKKQKLSDTLIDNEMDDTSYIKSLTEKDIRNLLSYENKD